MACCLQLAAQVRYLPEWGSLDKRPVPAWFAEAKFGVFIHWGVYSVPSFAPNRGDVYSRYAEWYWHRINPADKDGEAFREHHRRLYGERVRYQDFAGQFTAELFDAGRWADIIAASGARYAVLTSKHHEGFALWPSAQSVNWNSVDIGPHRDICGELTEAIRAKGLRMGFYYSLYEWNHPDYLHDVDRYVDEHMLPQLKDLTLRYSPDVIWADGEWEQPSRVWKSEDFLAWLFNESPVRDEVVVNDRWGAETRGVHGSFYTTEYGLVHDAVSDEVFQHPWEECRGIAGSFGFNRNENLADYSTSEELVHLLVDKVSKGGNLLLNIGPTADGRIPVIMQERLKDMGDWLQVNGEAIYGTCRWEAQPKLVEGRYFTRKGQDLYVILTRWNEQPLTLEGIGTPRDVSMLGTDRRIEWRTKQGRLTLVPPRLGLNEAPCRHAWVFRLSGVLNEE